MLELEADDVSYGAIPESTFAADPPAGTRVVDIDPMTGPTTHGRRTAFAARAVQRAARLRARRAGRAGRPAAHLVRLVDAGGEPAALSVYGEGMGAILVIQHEAGAAEREPRVRAAAESTSTAPRAPSSRRRSAPWSRSTATA